MRRGRNRKNKKFSYYMVGIFALAVVIGVVGTNTNWFGLGNSNIQNPFFSPGSGGGDVCPDIGPINGIPQNGRSGQNLNYGDDVLGLMKYHANSATESCKNIEFMAWQDAAAKVGRESCDQSLAPPKFYCKKGPVVGSPYNAEACNDVECTVSGQFSTCVYNVRTFSSPSQPAEVELPGKCEPGTGGGSSPHVSCTATGSSRSFTAACDLEELFGPWPD